MEKIIKILCVDDEKNVLRSLERAFFDTDYDILTANSGDEGLEILVEHLTLQLQTCLDRHKT